MTLDERLEALTQSLELVAPQQANAEKRHDREMEDIRREGRAMRTDLRRAFSMGVREARNQRRRSAELDEKITQATAALDEKITQLAAAQLVTEERLRAFIDSLHRGGNRNPAAF